MKIIATIYIFLIIYKTYALPLDFNSLIILKTINDTKLYKQIIIEELIEQYDTLNNYVLYQSWNLPYSIDVNNKYACTLNDNNKQGILIYDNNRILFSCSNSHLNNSEENSSIIDSEIYDTGNINIDLRKDNIDNLYIKHFKLNESRKISWVLYNNTLIRTFNNPSVINSFKNIKTFILF